MKTEVPKVLLRLQVHKELTRIITDSIPHQVRPRGCVSGRAIEGSASLEMMQ